MRVLLIKTSSMGDIIHTFPALTDAYHAIPDIRFDWVVEDAFTELPSWHPVVENVIPIALRRWRKVLFSRGTWSEWKQLRRRIDEHSYDIVLDAQALMKSAFITLFTKGVRAGLNWRSAREPIASVAYQRKYEVNFYQHAVVRMRSLFSQALNYSLPNTQPNFNLDRKRFAEDRQEAYLVFLHGTTWESKQWPELYWQELTDMASKAGLRVKMSGSTLDEVKRAERIKKHCESADVMPYLGILEMVKLIANAKAVVAVDTGLGHLAAALDVPTISIYGATNPQYTGALGKRSIHLAVDFACAPCMNRVCQYKTPHVVKPACYSTISPSRVWDALRRILHDQ